jgi:antitoxin HicB
MKAKAKAKRKARVGQRFDDFLKEEGMYEEVHAAAVKRVIAWQLGEAMRAKGMTKTEMAKRMNTSRSQLNRLLDPEIEQVELHTLARAAQVLGRNLRVELV